ncbi:MAG TPA: HAMP domain-containing protein [Streptosporangiaceae bacterium]|nr:HAMP domain-containing protein [Streptosporangiaceae bacterium]
MTDLLPAGRQLDESGLQQLLAGLTAVRGGDFSIRLRETGDPLMDQIASVFNGMADQLGAFTSEVTRVAREVGTEGKLGGQAAIPNVSGTWKDLTESVNAMADNLTDQVRNIAQVTTAVAGGDLSQKITVDARGEILELKNTVNTMVDQLSGFADEVTRVAREVGSDGRLGGQANVRGASGTWKALTDNVNVMASNLTDQVRSIAQVAMAVERGDLSRQITVDAKGEVAALAQTINTMVGTLSAFAGEVTRVAREVGTEGMLGGQATVPNVAGTWKDLTDNVNFMASNLTGQVRNIAQVTTAVAQGDLSRKIDVDARGEILELKTTINTMVDQLSSFAAEVTRVAREVGSEGRLGGQAEVEGVSGTWKRLTENVNELAGNLTRQVRAIAGVTSAVAAGDLTRSISVEAQGEVAELKDNINAMVQSLRETTRANQQQDWLKSNVARISGLMQGHRDLTVVAELIMDELAPLVGAQHGTFFLTEMAGGDTRLRLIAGYGLRADKDAPLQYRLGQSLIGQVAKSKRPIVVADLPEGYVKISSGLGEASPANLAVLPILFEDQVLGVIELASFTTFTPVQTDFLEQLTETLGVNVNTIVANARTDSLLKESQRLTGELQAQQDELQRSNADLEDKAEQLARQNSDIETKNAEIEQARQEIEERAQQLALASRYKSQFLANMSHELRTPLNSLLILARLLAQNPGGNLTGKQVEYANVIHSAGSDLLQLINDILDLSKVEVGRMDIHPERFTLRALLDDIQATFQPLTAEKGLTFAVDLAEGAPAAMFTDRQRLRQVLGNLLSNAVKFTSAGQVVLRVSPAGRTSLPGGAGLPGTGADGGPVVAFSVSDTGIGIAPDNLDAIFGAFEQGDGTLSRRYGGTGLGLTIAREVGALLGGDISADSELGRGSTFTLYVPGTLPQSGDDPLPLPPLPDEMRQSLQSRQPRLPIPSLQSLGPLESLATREVLEPPANGQPRDTGLPAGVAAAVAAAGGGPVHGYPPAEPGARRLLVLESAPGGLLTLLAYSAASDLADLADLADPAGPVQVQTVTRPDEAVELLRSAPHQCVVLDLGLPGAAAFAFLDQLRDEPVLGALPVLAHTRDNPDHAQARLLQHGLGDHRPLELLPSLDELRERIALSLSAPTGRSGADTSGRGGTGPHPVTSPAPPAARHEILSGRKVLVIDDDIRNVFAISSSLEPHGVIVLRATDGRQGIAALTAEPDVDLILMDVMMPEMDGYSTMAAIRQMPAFAALPIIAVTARAMPGDREKSLNAGASEYVTKPVDTEELLSRMERWLTGQA